jgi:esterase/lipase
MKLLNVALLLVLSTTLYAKTSWHLTKGSTKGQALVIHGLGTKPQSMQPVIKMFNDRNYDVLLLHLKGHSGKYEDMMDIHKEDWPLQIKQAHHLMTYRQKQIGGDIVFSGFSVGGLLLPKFIMQNQIENVDRMLLFAPAISLNDLSKAFSKIISYMDPTYKTPDYDKDKRALEEGTSLGAYQMMWEHYNDFHQHIKTTSDGVFLNIPTVVAMSPNDELIDYANTRKFMKYQYLTNWKMYTLNHDTKSESFSYFHYTISSEDVGDKLWNKRLGYVFDLITD